MNSAAPRSFGLDVARALAIVLVLASHGSAMILPWFGVPAPLRLIYTGTYGVTLFFALSGFLIGRILLRLSAQNAGWRDWRTFMVRRWTRTLPLYFLWLLVQAQVWPPQPFAPDHVVHLWHALPWFVTLTQNLAWPMVEDWFAVSWSLSVEEWFYLVFSAVLLLGGLWLGRGRAFWLVLLGFLLVPPLLRVGLPAWQGGVRSDTGIVLLRLDSVGYGVLMAWVVTGPGLATRGVRACLGTGLGLLAIYWIGALDWLLHLIGRWDGALTLALMPFGFALCLPAAARTGQVPAGVRRAVEAISNQSYGLYLCHLSILEWVDYYLRLVNKVSPISCTVTAGLAIWSFSYVSFHYFDAKLLTLRPRQRYVGGSAATSDAVTLPSPSLPELIGQ